MRKHSFLETLKRAACLESQSETIVPAADDEEARATATEEMPSERTSKIPLFVPLRWKGHRLKVFHVINDAQYGEIWHAYLDHQLVYIIDEKVVKEQKIIDELDDRYSIPVCERDIYE
jgi:hypothetical protein